MAIYLHLIADASSLVCCAAAFAVEEHTGVAKGLQGQTRTCKWSHSSKYMAETCTVHSNIGHLIRSTAILMDSMVAL